MTVITLIELKDSLSISRQFGSFEINIVENIHSCQTSLALKSDYHWNWLPFLCWIVILFAWTKESSEWKRFCVQCGILIFVKVAYLSLLISTRTIDISGSSDSYGKFRIFNSTHNRTRTVWRKFHPGHKCHSPHYSGLSIEYYLGKTDVKFSYQSILKL